MGGPCESRLWWQLGKCWKELSWATRYRPAHKEDVHISSQPHSPSLLKTGVLYKNLKKCILHISWRVLKWEHDIVENVDTMLLSEIIEIFWMERYKSYLCWQIKAKIETLNLLFWTLLLSQTMHITRGGLWRCMWKLVWLFWSGGWVISEDLWVYGLGSFLNWLSVFGCPCPWSWLVMLFL